MNVLKSNRSQFRRLFTKALNDFEKSEFDLSINERILKLRLIEEKAKPMLEMEETYREELIKTENSETIVNNEFDESECYIDKWRMAESKLASLLAEKDSSSVVNESFNENAVLRYPKLKLPTFDGNIKNWLGYRGQFKKIDTDPNLDDHDKFAYLLQSMEKGSSAEELIKSFPPGGESYSKALQQLQSRFCKEDILIEVYVRDLLSLVLLKNYQQTFSLRKLYDNLESKLRALEVLGVARDKYAAILYPLVESSLSDDALRAWQRFRAINRGHRERTSRRGKRSFLVYCKTEKLYDAYGEVFNEWKREGIIEVVPKSEIDLPCHYLPHRHVVKENSTTRIRPFFDALAKQKGSPSLNDCLEKGLNLQRFRINRIGVSADIRKAFLQISLYPKDKDYLRFLWYGTDGKLKYYRHCRVVFGVTSSPFLLVSVIQYLLESTLKELNENPKYKVDIIEQLKKSFYVDNCLASVKNELDLQQFIQVASDTLATRKLELRGWEYSDLTDNSSSTTNVLGMVWERCSDYLCLSATNITYDLPGILSKRDILATTHKVFDPLGIACPVTLIPKLLLQRLWKLKLSWDQEVDSNSKS
ncbi:hypothetical protein AVEN_248560-1 [Araneus ventricosus]|uniref:Reverse transcriptase domain-containing protein n=1 Tax=Araneus ventricosus TaxID=182803 RepID=A0A4Y2US47_ARAVE|nr:hypothetical protein AVEN_248560-1 [Araneus ventricosus]